MCSRVWVPNHQTYTELQCSFGVTKHAFDIAAVAREITPGANLHVLSDWRGETILLPCHWGFHGLELYNARSDSLHRPTWKTSFEYNRCVVPVTSFAERNRQYFHRAGELLYVAALYGVIPRTRQFCVSLITTRANAQIAPAHERMPLLMGADAVKAWISPSLHGKAAAMLGALNEYSKEVLLDSLPLREAVAS